MSGRTIRQTDKDVIRRTIHQEKLLSMESLFQFFDDVEDFIIATTLRLRRFLARKPRERRRTPRTSPAASQRQQAERGPSGRSDQDKI